MLRLFSAKGNLLQPLRTFLPVPKLHAPITHPHNKPFSSNTPLSNPEIDFILNEASEEFKSSKPSPSSSDTPKPQKSFIQNEEDVIPCGIRAQISHPWPEWVELMEMLLKGGYFDEIGHPFGSSEMGYKDFNQIRTACLNFARDRFDLIRFLSRVDIQVVAGSGCPSTDRKVVNSGKRLRAHMGVGEGNVCSSCVLRGNCKRAYVKACENEGGRTVDVMRFLLAYALEPVIGSVENKPCLNKKVKESVRKLLKEVVGFSTEELNHEQLAVGANSNSNASAKETAAGQGLGQISIPLKQGNWICPNCNFVNFARNVKCLRCDGLFLERLRKSGEEQDCLPLKKGDWICDKCNFLNFAKNTRCLQCKEKPTKRQLNPGEWECESCNYLNFRRNMVCLKCDHKRMKTFNSAALSSHSAGNDMVFHRARPCFGQEKHWIEKGSDEWEFVDNEGQNYSNSPSKDLGFIDFPVFGGNSELSRSREKQEKWRMEMSEKTRRVAKARVRADEFKSSINQSSELLQSADDEEMAKWFGHKFE